MICAVATAGINTVSNAENMIARQAEASVTLFVISGLLTETSAQRCQAATGRIDVSAAA